MKNKKAIPSIEREIEFRQYQCKHLSREVYERGYLPSESDIEDYHFWQSEIVFLKAELDLLLYGCSLLYKGFSWNYILDRKEVTERADFVDFVANTPCKLAGEISNVNEDANISGFEFYGADILPS